MTGVEENVHKRLVESGEYDRIRKHLRQKLKESGWFDRVNGLALEELSGQEQPNFDKVSRKIEPQALNLVPEDVKIELLRMIKSYLDEVIEKAP